MWVVAGLGNPGRKYSQTRHNAGFIFVKQLAREWNVKLKRKKYFVKAGDLNKPEERVVLVLPLTYMNRSGSAIREVLEKRNISPEKLVVVYDDLDIPLGFIRVRKEGGPGSHKGLNSIVQELATTKFSRIRLGIGSLSHNEDTTNFVLSSFNKDEKLLFEGSLKKAKDAVEMILAGEIDKAMNLYNTKVETLEQ